MVRISTLFGALAALASLVAGAGSRWSVEQSNKWYQEKGWKVGTNFIPSNAINQLEMWQAETFDPATIDRELGFAQATGFNAARVYLHHLAWEIDQAGFKDRVEQYLRIADARGITTMFVFMDDCWNVNYKAGQQPEPVPGVHNSGWVQDPGSRVHDQGIFTILEAFVKDIMTTYKNDHRVYLWDLYNEPGNSGWGSASLPTLQRLFDWAREINPSQPLSAGVWNLGLGELNKFQEENSDVITYHNYGHLGDHVSWVKNLRHHGRPLICTEYMARTRNSTFEYILPMLEEENIAAINWGLVAGKTNTIYEWDKPVPDGSEPEVWFHDVFRKDGTPFDQNETRLIKQLTDLHKP